MTEEDPEVDQDLVQEAEEEVIEMIETREDQDQDLTIEEEDHQAAEVLT